MVSVAPDNAAERNCGIVRPAGAIGSIERNCERGGNFQRTGHRNHVMADAGRLQLGDSAFQQRILDVVIKSRFDNQRARA